MKIYSMDDYSYLVQNGCYPDGYVEGLGMVSSQTVTVKSTSPSYPNERALGIDRRTQFIRTIQAPVITPLISPKSSKEVHEEMSVLMKKMIDENIAMPAFSPDLRAMIFRLKKEIEKKRSKNYENIREAKITLEKKPDNRRAQKKIRKAEEENSKLDEVEREIRKLAVSNQRYDLVTGYQFSKEVYQGAFGYNSNTGRAELQFRARKVSLHEFAHELKHAYQFETGTLSVTKLEESYGLYDKQDEREAFARGQLFGSGESFERNESIYDKVPDSNNFPAIPPTGKFSWNTKQGGNHETFVIFPSQIREQEYILQNPNASKEAKQEADRKLQSLSDRLLTVFHANGKTYVPNRWGKFK